MRYLGSLFVFTSLLSPKGFAEDEAADKGLAKLQGAWKLVSNDWLGETHKILPRAFQSNPSFYTLTIKGGNWSRSKEQFTFRIDPSKKPATIDFTGTEGFTKG